MKADVGPLLNRRQHAWLLVAALAAAAPLTPYFPTWIAALAGILYLWRAWLLWRQEPLPPRWLLTSVSLAFAGLIGLHYHTIFGRDPGVALLLAFLSLKLLETRRPRDAMAVVLLGGFLALALFFQTQSIITAADTALTVWLLTVALINVNHPALPTTTGLRLGAFLLAQATPFMLLLFVLFPRISGPLWGLPTDATAAVSGLSDTMAPGSISQLSQSDAIAFRARFDAPLPHADLYWRGPVLTSFDGRVWRGSRPQARQDPITPASGLTISYEVTLEPNNRRWLFALERAVGVPSDARITDDFQVLAKEPVRVRRRDALQSRITSAMALNETPQRLAEAQQLPPSVNPRARELARGLRAEHRDDAELIAALLGYFRDNPFFYTLQPPLLGDDSIDQFLFDTRRGFCEHYAGAFVFVLRAAGIPARVVTGYQGGEINPVDGFLVIRQYDAHAWAEAWLPGVGWQRFDPTAAIAPARVESNLAAAVPAGDPLPLMARVDITWLRELRFRWEALNNGWNQWVLGYNPQRQRDLLRALGMREADWQTMAAWLSLLCGGVMLLLTAWAVSHRPRSDPLLQAWNRFSAKAAKYGYGRRDDEGPQDYAQRLCTAAPHLAEEVQAIAGLYASLRYGRIHGPTRLRELSQRVRLFQFSLPQP